MFAEYPQSTAEAPMKNTAIKLLIAPAILVCAMPAFGAPSIKSYWSGSYYFIDAANSEDRSYSCTFSYTFAYDDFGSRKTKDVSGSFTVSAKSSINAHKLTGAWVNPAITNGPNIQCN